MVNISSVGLIEIISKGDIKPCKNLKSQFYKHFKENTFGDYQIKLKFFGKWLVKNITKFFNRMAAIREHQERDLRR